MRAVTLQCHTSDRVHHHQTLLGQITGLVNEQKKKNTERK